MFDCLGYAFLISRMCDMFITDLICLGNLGRVSFWPRCRALECC